MAQGIHVKPHFGIPHFYSGSPNIVVGLENIIFVFHCQFFFTIRHLYLVIVIFFNNESIF